MGIWGLYQSRIEARGSSMREAALQREVRMLNSKMKDSLSYHNVAIDGVPRNVSIINSDNYNEKTMFSLPGEDIRCGALVEWADNFWLVTEKDANIELYTRVKLLQCNYLLKWVDDNNIIREQWCVIEDGTKYLTGEYEDRDFIVTRGDTRISMTIARNEYTAKFKRETRFIIDDPDSPEKIAYLLTKPLKVGRFYNGNGVYVFVLQEVVTTDDDNLDLRIADYYKHFPRDITANADIETDGNDGDAKEKEVWI